MIKITGMENLQKKLNQVSMAIEALNKPVLVPEYDCHDPMSVHASIANVEQQIDDRTAPYLGNSTVLDLGSKAKKIFQEKILTAAAQRRLENEEGTMVNQSQTLENLRQLQNAVNDMQLIDHQSAESHFETLAHILESDGVSATTHALVTLVDLDSWLKAGENTQGSMVGSASRKLPLKIEERLGLVIAIIKRIANGELSLFQFAHTFYHTDSNITSQYRYLVAQMINPFLRDYRDYVVKKMGVNMDEKKSNDATSVNQYFNFNNSQVAALQTGNHAIANVTMHNTSAGAAELVKALDAVAAALAQTKSVGEHDKHEILEIVKESKEEVAKERPNNSKLRTYLSTIGGVIGAAADLKPAYEILGIAAAAAGFPLPSLS